MATSDSAIDIFFLNKMLKKRNTVPIDKIIGIKPIACVNSSGTEATFPPKTSSVEVRVTSFGGTKYVFVDVSTESFSPDKAHQGEIMATIMREIANILVNITKSFLNHRKRAPTAATVIPINVIINGKIGSLSVKNSTFFSLFTSISWLPIRLPSRFMVVVYAPGGTKNDAVPSFAFPSIISPSLSRETSAFSRVSPR